MLTETQQSPQNSGFTLGFGSRWLFQACAAIDTRDNTHVHLTVTHIGVRVCYLI